MAADKYLNLEGLERVAGYVLKVVTSIPVNPNNEDIVLYKGATSGDFIQGCIYMYEEGIDYYAWSDGTDTYYTLSTTPAVGDDVYQDTEGTLSTYTVSFYDPINDEITVNSIVYPRTSAGDVNTSKWVLQDTSVILNGSDKTGDEANFYAPETSGDKGQMLVSNGDSKAPTWASFSGYCPQIVDNQLCFYYGIIPDVENTAIIFDL